MLQTLINGLAFGGVYALIAVGFLLIYQVSGVLNFAQGDLAMIGAYLGVVFSHSAGLPLFPSLLLTILAMALLGAGFEFIGFRPLEGKPVAVTIISTIALGIILRNAALLIWGPDPQTLGSFVSSRAVGVVGADIDPRYLLILGAAMVLIAAQHGLLSTTMVGRRLQATAQDRDAARLMGISVTRSVRAAFMVSAGLAGAAGFLVAPLFSVTTDMGSLIGLKAFVACVIGGFGSLPGAALAAFGIGVVENLAATYGAPEYRDATTFVLLIVFLLAVPRGLFGEKVGEKL